MIEKLQSEGKLKNIEYDIHKIDAMDENEGQSDDDIVSSDCDVYDADIKKMIKQYKEVFERHTDKQSMIHQFYLFKDKGTDIFYIIFLFR